MNLFPVSIFSENLLFIDVLCDQALIEFVRTALVHSEHVQNEFVHSAPVHSEYVQNELRLQLQFTKILFSVNRFLSEPVPRSIYVSLGIILFLMS